MARANSLMNILAVAIVVFFGLAIHVISRNPRRPISWVFGMFCLAMTFGFHISALFLIVEPEISSPVTLLALRWKYAVGSFCPTLFLHLMFFYFPPSWQRYRLWALSLAYLFSIGLAFSSLFTDLLVAGPLYRPPPLIVGVIPGPLMYLFAGSFALIVVVSTVGLIMSFRSYRSPSFHRQILYMLIPTGLAVLSGVIAWISILIPNARYIPTLLINLPLVIGGFLYARAVIQYGSFVDRPTAWRDLFYSLLGAIASLIIIYTALTLDRRLAVYTPFPYPLTTGILVVTVAVGFPIMRQRITEWLDAHLFHTEPREQKMAYRLARTLTEIPNAEHMQAELLNTLCTVLDVQGGYVATLESDLPPNTLAVQFVQGNCPLQPGASVPLPPLNGQKPQLASSILSPEKIVKNWPDVTLFCPLTVDQTIDGILALGEKRNRKPFTYQELELCAELARQVSAAKQMAHLRQERDRHLEAAHAYGQSVRQLGEEVITTVEQTMTAWEGAPNLVEIHLLGPLQVSRNGQPVPEAAWGTEKAKALLTYLLWKGSTGATREEISTTLWPHRPAEETANIFHVTLHHLRRTLEPELQRTRNSSYIIHERGRYRFKANAPHWLDVITFETLARSDESTAWQKAVNLYRGPYLQDMAWTLPPDVEMERRRLEQLYLDALRRLAARTKGYETARYLEKLLAIEPTDETAQQALVLNYLSRGRRDLAQAQIQRWQETLVELDLAPSPEARALWQRVEGQPAK